MERFARRLIMPAVALSLTAAACGDEGDLFPGGTSPEQPGVSAIVVDASRNGGAAGFYLLPPVADQPVFGGTFNPSLMPSAVPCLFSSEPLDLYDTNLPQTPAGFSGQGSCIDPIPGVLEEADEQYKSAWDTAKDEGGVWRVFVTFGAAPSIATLGYVDIKLISGGGARRARDNADVDVEIATAGRTIPIKYRIEQEASVQLADAFATVLIPSPSGAEVCDPVNQSGQECIVTSVPTSGGTFVVPGANPFGGAIAGIELQDGWSSIPRNLLITCNNGTFSTGANVTTDFAQMVFTPGDGPLGSNTGPTADPNVIAEWPLFCEFVFDPPFEQANDPDGDLLMDATIGLCDVDPDSDSAQDPLHHTDLDLGTPLIQVGRNRGGLDGLPAGSGVISGTGDPVFDHTGTSATDDFVKAAAPSFLDCTGAAAPIASAIGTGLQLPDVFGNFASIVGDLVTPDALYASGMLVRDGGIGATIGSVRTIYGLVELDPGPVSDYTDPVGFLNLGTGGQIPSNWTDASFDPTTGGNGGTMSPGIFVTAQGQGTTCSIYNPPNGSTTDPLVVGTTYNLNETIVLQKRFDLSAAASGLKLHIAIDNDFRFAVNGVEYTLDATNAPFVYQLDGDPVVGLHSSRTSAPAFPAAYNRGGTHGLSIGGGWLRHENCAVEDDVVIDLTGVMIPGQENVITVLARDRGTVGVVGMKIEAEYGSHSH